MKSKILAAAAISLAVFGLSVSNVFAWNYSMSGEGRCASDGSFQIKWTVNNTAENEPLIVTGSSNTGVVAVGAQIPAHQTADFFQNNLDGTKPGSFGLTVTGHFPSDQTPRSESASVKLDQACSQPTPPPCTCSLLDVIAGDNRVATITTFRLSAPNAVLKDAVINWGDNSAPLTTATVVNQTHQYAKDGTYTISVIAHFTVNGKDVTASGPTCRKTITFKTHTPPPVTPPATPPAPAPSPAAPTATPTPPSTTAAPTELVNTGPGSLIGIFTATTVAGTMAYRRQLSRRLSRQ